MSEVVTKKRLVNKQKYADAKKNNPDAKALKATDLTKPQVHPGGRPTKYNQDIVNELCALLSIGKSLGTACKELNLEVKTIYNWIDRYPEFLQKYTRAKEDSADFMAEELLDISDDGRNDYMEDAYMKGKSPGWSVNGENIQRSKLRVDTRKFLMSKMKPKKYGDKIDVTSDGKALPTPILGVLMDKKAADAIPERVVIDAQQG